jgi:hypothetical protein
VGVYINEENNKNKEKNNEKEEKDKEGEKGKKEELKVEKLNSMPKTFKDVELFKKNEESRFCVFIFL